MAPQNQPRKPRSDSVEQWNVPPDLRKGMNRVANDLRKRQTRSEALLWEALRNRKLDGWKFRRQAPIGAFVVDFYCSEARLALEIDGSIHAMQAEADQLRQEVIETLGIRFLRFSAEQVERELQVVVAEIRVYLEKRG